MKIKKVIVLVLLAAICFSVLVQPAAALAEVANEQKIVTGSEYYGFKCLDSKVLNEVDGVLYTFEHIKTGAELAFFQNNDTNKAFTVTFKTPPADDKGIPHIIEHSVLNGSEKYPLKNPFARMLSQSFNTFLNAFTTEVYTSYPVASRNDKDFRNLVSVYIDSVFAPKLLENKNIFMQEGIRKEIIKEEDPIIYNGIVYNEMKGIYTSPYQYLNRVVNKVLYSDTPYKYDSGGDPQAIESLTYEEYIEFYNKYYHPSNALFYFYGDLDILEYMKYIDNEYLNRYDNRYDVLIPRQEESGNNLQGEFVYPTAAEGTEDKTYYSLSYMIGEYGDLEEQAAFSLSAMALQSDDSPLKKAFKEAGLGTDYKVIYNWQLQQPKFEIILSSADGNSKDLFVKTVKETLKDIVKEGLDREFIYSVLDTSELYGSQSKFDAQKWQSYLIQITVNWLFNKPLHLGFEEDISIDEFKDKIDKGYLEELIDQYIIKSKHSALVVLNPSPGLQYERDAQTAKKLEEFKNSLTEEQLNALIKENTDLINWQNTPDTEEAVRTLPTLTLDDIDTESIKEVQVIEAVYGDMTVLYTPCNVGDLVYTNLYFDTTRVPQEKLEYLRLLVSLLGGLSTEKYNFGELNNAVMKKTGGISFGITAFGDVKDSQNYYPKMVASFFNLFRNTPDAIDLVDQIIYKTKFTEFDRIREIVTTSKESMRNGNPVLYVYSRIRGYNSNTALYNDIPGIDYYKFLCEVEELLNTNPDKVLEEIKGVYELTFPKQELIVGVTCKEENYETYIDCMKNTAETALKEVNAPKQNYTLEVSEKNEAFIDTSSVQYVAKGYNFNRTDGYEYSGKMIVLGNILNDYLFGTVRMQLGAYGALFQAERDGAMTFISWQDPNLKETYQVYDNTAMLLENLNMTKQQMESYIIGSIGQYDLLLNPQDMARIAQGKYISNDTTTKAQVIEEILNTTVEDINKFAPLFKDVAKSGNYCAWGGEQKIQENRDLFKNVVNAFEYKPEEVIKYGDVNGDEKINCIDCALIRMFILGMIEEFPYKNGENAADVNGDEEINSTDFILVKEYILEKIREFPVEVK